MLFNLTATLLEVFFFFPSFNIVGNICDDEQQERNKNSFYLIFVATNGNGKTAFCV